MSEATISRVVTVTRAEDARQILKSTEHRSDRLRCSYGLWASPSYPDFLPQVRAFFADWLMYREGTGHADQRARARAALRRLSKTWDFDFEPLLPADTLDDSDIEALTCHAYQVIFGVSAAQVDRIREISHPLSLFVTDTPPSAALSAQVCQAFAAARDFLDAESFSEASWPGRAREHGVEPSVIMNLLIDSFDPLYAALSTTVLTWSETPRAGFAAIDAALSAHPPFRYINRIKWLGPDRAEKTSIDLKACAATDPHHSRLYFGIGRHACLGQKACRDSATALWASLAARYRGAKITRISGTAVDRSGMCAAENVKLAIQTEAAP